MIHDNKRYHLVYSTKWEEREKPEKTIKEQLEQSTEEAVERLKKLNGLFKNINR